MLSPGQWHKRVPRDYAANLRFRLLILRKCRQQPKYRKAVLHMCRHDFIFFVAVFGFQVNPKKLDREVGPFVPWDFQIDAALKTIGRLFDPEAPDDVLWEKSRELGATWWALFIALWLVLFRPHKRVLVVSHSEQAVEKAGNMGTLFAKIVFMLRYLPGWMKKGVKKTKLNFQFAGESSISGYATTGRAGVGDRVAMVLLDEFSKQQAAAEILGQTADTGPRLFIGTHYGIGTTFFDLTQRPDMFKVVMHWSQHPDKMKGLYRYDPAKKRIQQLDLAYHFPPDYKFVLDATPSGGPCPGLRSPWYDRECIRRASSRDVAMHLDIDPQGSQAQFFDPALIRILTEEYTCEPYWRGELQYDRARGVPLALVPSPTGSLKLWCNLVNGWPVRGTYGIGADVSYGNGATPSCASVGDARTGEKVAEYADSFISADEFGTFLVALSWIFKTDDEQGALLAWEMAGPGFKTGKQVIELGYRRIYYRKDNFKLGTVVSDNPGWYPDGTSKRLLLEDYRAALVRRQFINRSAAALAECLNFAVQSNGKVEHGGQINTSDPTAARENHGDLTIGDALCWKMLGIIGQPGEPKALEEEIPFGSLAYRRQMRDNARRREEVWA